MSDRNHEQEWERLANVMKDQHNRPGDVPRDRMWARIEEERAKKRESQAGPSKVIGRINPRIWRTAAAAAAVLLVGISIGRMSIPDPTVVPGNLQVAAPNDPVDPAKEPPIKNNPAGNLLYRKAATDLFGRADALLTGFKVTPCVEQDLETVPDWASGMLLQTRLLMNTPLAEDQEMENLLLDLELVLAQIVGLNKDNCARDVAWIRDAMAQKAL
jgi:hypothetical protein